MSKKVINKNHRYWIYRNGSLDETTENAVLFRELIKDPGTIGLDNGFSGDEKWTKWDENRGYYDPYELASELDGGGHVLLACQVKN